MCGSVWIDKSTMSWVRACRKGCSRPSMSGVSEQGRQDCVGREMVDGLERGWMWYNKVGWVRFRITIKVSY